MEREEDFFVGIYNPVDVRRNLLESSKEVIRSLQTHDKLEAIRTQKLALVKRMQLTMKELDLLVSKLKTRLPKSYLRKAEGFERKPDKAYPAPLVKNSSPELSGDLARLEEQLKNVEKELGGLK